ncbi:hypothetical protein ABW21_db0200018 [Orbilia brochopaga]|nr:hypothetical protein ABW21_db0200018 [Drechslerella brochopaga]
MRGTAGSSSNLLQYAADAMPIYLAGRIAVLYTAKPASEYRTQMPINGGTLLQYSCSARLLLPYISKAIRFAIDNATAHLHFEGLVWAAVATGLLHNAISTILAKWHFRGHLGSTVHWTEISTTGTAPGLDRLLRNFP